MGQPNGFYTPEQFELGQFGGAESVLRPTAYSRGRWSLGAAADSGAGALATPLSSAFSRSSTLDISASAPRWCLDDAHCFAGGNAQVAGMTQEDTGALGPEGSSDEIAPLDPRYDHAATRAGIESRTMTSVDWRAYLAAADRQSLYRLRVRCELAGDSDGSPSVAVDQAFDVAWGTTDRVRVMQHLGDPTTKDRKDRAGWLVAGSEMLEWSIPADIQEHSRRERIHFAPAFSATHGSATPIRTKLLADCSAGSGFDVNQCNTDFRSNYRAGRSGIVGEFNDGTGPFISGLPVFGSSAIVRGFGGMHDILRDHFSEMTCTYWARRERHVPVSCTEIRRTQGSSAASGLYWILSREPLAPTRRMIRVFCDMEAFAGGFTLMASFSSTGLGTNTEFTQAEYDRLFGYGGWIFGRFTKVPDTDFGSGTSVSSYAFHAIVDTMRAAPPEHEVRQRCHAGYDPTGTPGNDVHVSQLFNYSATQADPFTHRLPVQCTPGTPATMRIPLREFASLTTAAVTFDSADEGHTVWAMPFLKGISTGANVMICCYGGGSISRFYDGDAGDPCTQDSQWHPGGSGFLREFGAFDGGGSDYGIGCMPYMTTPGNYDIGWLHQNTSVLASSGAPHTCSYSIRDGIDPAAVLTATTRYANGGNAPVYISVEAGSPSFLGYPGYSMLVTVDGDPCDALYRNDGIEISCGVSATSVIGSTTTIQVDANPAAAELTARTPRVFTVTVTTESPGFAVHAVPNVTSRALCADALAPYVFFFLCLIFRVCIYKILNCHLTSSHPIHTHMQRRDWTVSRDSRMARL
jgi:hypothetical protein